MFFMFFLSNSKDKKIELKKSYSVKIKLKTLSFITLKGNLYILTDFQ